MSTNEFNELLPGIKKGKPKESTKGVPPAIEATTNDNLEKVNPDKPAMISFWTTHAKRLEISNYAKERGETTTSILLKAFDEYKQRHP